jgi:hypothetical protein
MPNTADTRRLNKPFLLQLGLPLLFFLRGFVHSAFRRRLISRQHLISRDLRERNYMVVRGTSAQDQIWVARVNSADESPREGVRDLNSCSSLASVP